MFKFSKRVQYGITALMHLMQQDADELVSTHALSETYGIPEEHLGKVLQKMARGGLLESIQGAHGGYRMIRGLSEISLGELVEALDGPIPVEEEPVTHDHCGAVCTCYVRGVLDVSQQLIRSRMFEFTLEQILERTGLRKTA